MSKGVTRTAEEARTCKASAFSNGDTNAPRKTPLLNRVYMQRGKLMHKFVAAIIDQFAASSGDSQLIVLGGGLDTSYDVYGAQVFVADFEDVIVRRRSLYQSLPTNLHLVAGDLRQADTLLADLVREGLSVNQPTTILIECVLAYVDSESCQRLLSRLSHTLKNCVIVLYDPVLPHGSPLTYGFAQLMYDKFAERGAPLIGCVRTIEEYGDLLSSTGWPHVIAASINEAQQLFLSRSERAKGTQHEPFDEFASLALLQNYYGVCIASTNKTVFDNTVHQLRSSANSCDIVDTQDRMRKLEIRAAVAERRLLYLERRKPPQRTKATPSSLNIAIRTATLQDTNTLVQLYQAALHEPALKYKSVQQYVKMSSKALKQIEKTYPVEQGSVLFLAEAAVTEGGASQLQTLGCLGVKLKVPETSIDSTGATAALAELSHFCVAPAFQKQGVGNALLDQAVQYCANRLGSRYSVCLTVLKDLEAARRLYAAAGFELISTEKLGADCEICYLRKDIV